MADEVPRAGPPAKPHWPHGWLEYGQYRDVHLSHMRTLEREGLVVADALTFEHITGFSGTLLEVHVFGRIECAEDTQVRVDKWLEYRNGMVRGIDYSYHAWLSGGTPQQLVRYDNALGHGDDAPVGRGGNLHRHVFDLRTGELVHIEPLTLDMLPNLNQVVIEAVELARRARSYRS